MLDNLDVFNRSLKIHIYFFRKVCQLQEELAKAKTFEPAQPPTESECLIDEEKLQIGKKHALKIHDRFIPNTSFKLQVLCC